MPQTRAVGEGLSFTFIGNEAFFISDGHTTLLTDFPYQSGAFGYMTYDRSGLPAVNDGVCLITHGHADHFDAAWFEKTDFAIIAPRSVSANLKTQRLVAFAPEMQYRDIRVRAFRTPHGDVEHYSYLVSWHGLLLYLTGDTDDLSVLERQSGLDVAFLTPWQLAAFRHEHKRIPSKRVVIYHQRSDEEVPMYQRRLVPRQGESFELPFPRHAP